ncbi:MAG: hypothetical protein LWW87_01840 [Geobacteraceae bacterium]|nr:hypothetical protein [Geobacteraceae bacterium]
MPSKETYCYRILKTYSLIVDFDGEPMRENVPSPVQGETFRQWKKRVFGDAINDVVVYIPTVPSPTKRISTLQNVASAEHLEKIFGKIKRDSKSDKNDAVAAAKEQTKKEYISFPKETLESYLDEFGDTLEVSVRETLKRFAESVDSGVDSEKLVKELIEKYNKAVKRYRSIQSVQR